MSLMTPFGFSAQTGRKGKPKKRRKRWRFLWERHSNGMSYPSYNEWFTFRTGRLALIVALLALLFAIIGLWT